MSASERLGYYEELEGLRKRPLLVYVTSTRVGLPGQISADVIAEFQDQLQKLPRTDEVDLLVVSNGGDPTVSWRLMTLLRERVKHVTVLVPQAAFSAATLLALGADQIIMHPNGNLGPVDPQIIVTKPNGKDVEFAFEDLHGVMTYTEENLKLTDNSHRLQVFDRICAEIGALAVGFAARRSLLSRFMGEKLLQMHMKDDLEGNAKAIVEALNTKFYDHGYPLSRSEAREILNRSFQQDKDRVERVEELMWAIWCDIEEELRLRQPFDIVFEWAGSQDHLEQAAVFLDPETFDKYKHAAFPLRVVTAVLESKRYMSENAIEGKILVTRTGPLEYETNSLVTRQGWVKRPMDIKVQPVNGG